MTEAIHDDDHASLFSFAFCLRAVDALRQWLLTIRITKDKSYNRGRETAWTTLAQSTSFRDLKFRVDLGSDREPARSNSDLLDLSLPAATAATGFHDTMRRPQSPNQQSCGTREPLAHRCSYPSNSIPPEQHHVRKNLTKQLQSTRQESSDDGSSCFVTTADHYCPSSQPGRFGHQCRARQRYVEDLRQFGLLQARQLSHLDLQQDLTCGTKALSIREVRYLQRRRRRWFQKQRARHFAAFAQVTGRGSPAHGQSDCAVSQFTTQCW